MSRDRKFQSQARIRSKLARKLVAFATAALLAGFAVVGAAQAAETGRDCTKTRPCYASLKAPRTYFRQGPDFDHAILWELRRQHLPVRVIGTFDVWRRVELHTGELGWIHSSRLSARRFATPITDDVKLYAAPRPAAKPVSEKPLPPTLPLRLRRCQREWCEVETAAESAAHRPLSGWVMKRSVWGVSGDDVFD